MLDPHREEQARKRAKALRELHATLQALDDDSRKAVIREACEALGIALRPADDNTFSVGGEGE